MQFASVYYFLPPTVLTSMGGSYFWFTFNLLSYYLSREGLCKLFINTGLFIVDLGHELAWAALALGWHCVKYSEQVK